MHTDTFHIADLPEAHRHLLYRWMASSGARGLPLLDDFQHGATLDSSKNFVFTEIHDGPGGLDFELMYIGPNVRAFTSPKLEGKRLSNMPGKGPGSQLWAAYEALFRKACPLYVSLPYVGPLPGYVSTQELFLPLGDGKSSHPRYALALVALDPKMPAGSRTVQEIMSCSTGPVQGV
ncbi:hypothetical protein [Tropicibacter naphthalenivorans]|uniref:PAS domain protein n=1 Tax=Tropicibacter naphthalenivorans TaxID=441103 RepID=A0A0P1GVB3_9RHOB|nr:hypothetical protein [Tropicibacter naphthalenivorans]CUH79046.1 hypothetical protein TRN7648_02295 [Tropicibacter naphthalenivorans]SMD03770.1 hypothetical protein SAMN04488093_11179 [Tropicibacter naphthalenivorans]